jgi:hypothetical protein
MVLPEPDSADDAAMVRLRQTIETHLDKLMQAFN